ncbi:MAG: sensor histidine kinase [Egibacteraceae bacterium]
MNLTRDRWDRLLALAVTAGELGILAAVDHHAAGGQLAAGTVIAVLTGLPLIYRRRAPFAAFLMIWLATLAHGVVGLHQLHFSFGLVIALYSLAAYGRRPAPLAGLAVVVAGTIAGGAALGAVAELPWVVVSVAAVWLLGTFTRTRLLYIAEVEARADQAEREREQRARLAVVEERARIARELHDVLAHGVTVMLLQAGAARSKLRKDPDQADAALERVEDAARASLADLRSLLGLLSGEPDGQNSEARLPQPDIADVEPLVEQFRTAGLPVRLEIDGRPRAVQGAVSVSAYRIVQEALTNALKHSRPQQVRVGLGWDPDALRIEVSDDGEDEAPRGGAAGGDRDGAQGAGRGLVGMRERVKLLGGTITTGRRGDRGFAVRVKLPLEEASG